MTSLKPWIQKHRQLLTAAAVGLATIAVIFPDVIFLRASFGNAERLLQGARPKSPGAMREDGELRSFYPERHGRTPIDGLSDGGGAAFQSEPGQLFMRHAIYHGESPFWNPYSAAGSLGPETLVDIKFSPFSLLVALLGGGTLAFHGVALALYAFAVACLFRLLTECYELSRGAAVAAGIVYLLNGYFIANLASNVSQSYLYFPPCLLGLYWLTRKPTAWAYLAVVAANVALLATTFMPTTSLLVVCVYLTSGGFVLKLRSRLRDRLGALALQWSGAALAAGLLAFLYLPVVDSFAFLGTLEMYGARIFYPTSWHALLSLFTPKHFWESYNAINPVLLTYVKNCAFHVGIIPSLVLVQVFSSWRKWSHVLALVPLGILCVAVGRIYDLPGLKHIVEILPFFRSVGCQYWWMAVAFAFPLLFAQGCHIFLSGQGKLWPMWALSGVMLALIVFLTWEWMQGVPGFPSKEPPVSLRPSVSRFYLAMALAAIAAPSVLLWRMRNHFVPRPALWLTLAVFAELIFYTNSMRFTRKNLAASPPDHIAFLKAHAGTDRVLNYGIYALPPEFSAAFQIHELGSMNMNIIPSYYRFYERNFLPDKNRWGLFCIPMDTTEEPKLNESVMDLMGVKYIAVSKYMNNVTKFFEDRGYPAVCTSETAIVFENKRNYPRAFVASQLVKADLTPETLDLSPRTTACTLDEKLLAAANSAGVCQWQTDRDGCSDVDLVEYHHASVRLKTSLTAPGVVVLTDCWHPAWKAYANGQEVYVGKVNETLRGVALPAGDYDLEFKYEPVALAKGLKLSGFSAALLGSMLLVLHLKQRASAKRVRIAIQDSELPRPALRAA